MGQKFQFSLMMSQHVTWVMMSQHVTWVMMSQHVTWVTWSTIHIKNQNKCILRLITNTLSTFNWLNEMNIISIKSVNLKLLLSLLRWHYTKNLLHINPFGQWVPINFNLKCGLKIYFKFALIAPVTHFLLIMKLLKEFDKNNHYLALNLQNNNLETWGFKCDILYILCSYFLKNKNMFLVCRLQGMF